MLESMPLESVIGTAALVVGTGLWAVDSAPPVTLSLDQWLCGLAGLILAQGLVRDLRVIASRRRARAAGEAPPPPTGPVDAPSITGTGPELNVCLESTTGLMMLGLALLYVAFPVPPPITLPRGAVVAGAGLVLIVGWLTRDWVLTLRYIRDHYDVPVWRMRK